MSASLGEPFLLSSYGLPKHLSKGNDNGELRRAPSNAYATHERVSGSSDGHVTVTVQGDGLHLLDLSNLHPVVSHTLGPSTSFSCPAISRNTIKDGKNICTTYAVIESSPDVRPEESGRTVWIWTENMSTNLEKVSRKKTSAVAPHAVSRLLVLEDLPSCVILLSSKGEMSVMDVDLNIHSTGAAPTDGRVLLDNFVFSRRSCSFLPARSTPPLGAIVVSLVRIGKTSRVQVVALDEEHRTVDLGDSEIKIDPDEISGASCSTSGYLSILVRDGSWHSFQLESTNGTSIGVADAAETIYLGSFSFLSSSPPCPDEISLLSLGSSHVLLAAVTKGPAQELALLLWDLQYSVLVASHCQAIPSTLSHSKDNSMRMDLVATSTPQALLLLTPSTHPSSWSTLRSSILVVPYTVPATSTIAAAMGRSSSGMKWLAQGKPSFSPDSSQLDSRREKLLNVMRSAMGQNRPANASAAFFEWNKQETTTHKKKADHSGRGKSEESGHFTGHVAESAFPETSQPEFSYTFVKQLLDIVLQPSKAVNMPYSSDVLRHLLERGVISGGMIEGGILSVLRSRNDWESIQLALNSVRDVSEADIIQVLQVVITQHRHGDADAMQVDSTPADISLAKFLSSCVSYTTSSATMQLAIREHLRDVEDLVCVLEVLENWICTWVTKDPVLLPKEGSVQKQNGVFVVEPCAGMEDLPPLMKILSFLQTLLDASFLMLLQHPSCHQILQKISAHFESELASIDQTDPLRGPLEPFAKAQARAVKAASEGGRREPPVDWRRRKRQAHERTAIAVGLYRLEELEL